MIRLFDVFDTCVTRVHAYPRDLFFELGLRLAPLGLDNKTRRQFARRFQRARVRAEKIANWRARPREAADLREIYANFQLIFRSSIDTHALVLAEIALEEESMYSIPTTVAKIDVLRRSGHRIVFVSDMYIPGRLLAPILCRLGVMQEGDALYVSCDSGLTKHSGKLFEHVLRSEDIDSHEVIHMGDNPHADARMAEQCGIRTLHFRNAWLNRHELRIAGEKSPRPAGRSFLAALSRRARLTAEDTKIDSKQPLDEVIYGVIAPFLIGYVQWILDDAAKRGIRRLYFVARDGEILYKVARELNPPGIELRYLYGSRRAWLAPSITPNTPEWQRLLVMSGGLNSPHDIACRAGLDEQNQVALRNALDMNEAQWSAALKLGAAQRFAERLLANQESAALVLASTQRKRDEALQYFQQEGLLDEINWALVDAGWSLNSQSALKRILGESGHPHQTPKGYYIGLARDHLNEEQSGEAFAFAGRVGSIFSRRRVIVEHCFLPSTHPSTCGYVRQAGRVFPVLGDEARSDLELSYAGRVHEITLHTARLASQNQSIRDALRIFTSDIQQVAEDFIRNPRREDAFAMSSFGAIADMRQERAFVEPLCRPLSFADVWKALTMSLSKQRMFKEPSYMWLEGSVAISLAPVQLPLKLMLWMDQVREQFRSKT